MSLKRIIQIAVVIVFFIGEMIISFSIKEGKSNDQVNIDNAELPYSHRINNNLTELSSMAGFDSTVLAFIDEYSVKGASVAVSREGKLIYAKGYGLADSYTGEEVEPKHLFRIASVSKLITATAILKLAEDGKLDINQKVFGPNGIYNEEKYRIYNDSAVELITIDHLLKHTSGLFNKKADLMFMPLHIGQSMGFKRPANVDEIIEYALHLPMDSKPGGEYDYCNLGYAILGRIIEKTSGLSYEQYVKFEILEPLDITEMRIGRNYYEERASNEVQYFEYDTTLKVLASDGSGKHVSIPYGGNDLQLIAATGGWIASPVELMKFILAVDGKPDPVDILSKESIEYMLTPFNEDNYLVGWKATDGHGITWRTGTLTGSSSLVMMLPNDVVWIMMMNSTTEKRHYIHSYVAQNMFRALATVENWPKEDLYFIETPIELALNNTNIE